MPMVTGAFSQLLVPGLRRVFFQHLKERPTQYDKIFNTHTSSRAFEEDLEVAGLGTMPTKLEGTATIYQDAIQGGKKRYTHISFGLGFRVTIEMMEDDLYNVMRRMSRELAKAARNVREVRSFNVFNNAFTTEFGFQKFGNNEALIGTHTLLGGGTFANRPATDADLGIASLEAAILNYDTLVDEQNMPALIMPKVVLVHPEFKQVARELLNSEFRPYTANNEINAIMQEGLTWFMSQYLTDTDAWFLLADKADHDLNFFERAAVRFQNGDDFDTGDAKFKAFQRFSVGAGEWRGVYGSTGA